MTKHDHIAHHYTRIMQGWGRHLSQQDGEDAIQDACCKALRVSTYKPELDKNGSALAQWVTHALCDILEVRRRRAHLLTHAPMEDTLECPVCWAQGQREGALCTKCGVGLPKGSIYSVHAKMHSTTQVPQSSPPMELEYRWYKAEPVLQYLQANMDPTDFALVVYATCQYSTQEIIDMLKLTQRDGSPMRPSHVWFNTNRARRRMAALLAKYQDDAPVQ